MLILKNSFDCHTFLKVQTGFDLQSLLASRVLILKWARCICERNFSNLAVQQLENLL